MPKYTVPYSAPCLLSDGKKVIVHIEVPHHADKFSINFCKGRDHHSETVLHFNPRFHDNSVVRNHFHGSWGSEEKHGGNPFRKGERFEVEFDVKGDEIKVYVNQNHFCDFKLRIGKEHAHNIFIEGDVIIKKIDLPHSSHDHPHVPFVTGISGLHFGKKITISGIPHGTDRFTVALAHGPDVNSHDVVFLFDVRFNFSGQQNRVVRNSKFGGWGAEETHASSFPFAANTPFVIVIKVKDGLFKVTVNDEKFTTYNFRDKGPEHVTHLIVTGDVKLTHVKA